MPWTPRALAGALFLGTACGHAPAHPPGEDPARAARLWPELTRKGEAQKARALCEPWLASSTARLAAEGHKCLANVELIGARSVRIEGNRERGGFIGSGFNGPGVDRALDHLAKGMALAPDDLSIH